MNFTNDYNDQLEGDFLACRPSNIAEGLRFICNYAMPALGWTYLFNGFWCVCLAYTQRRHAQLQTNQVRDVDSVPNARNSSHPQHKDTGRFSYMEKVELTMGMGTVGIGLMTLVYGYGTMYPTTHVRAQIGDAVTAITYPAWWYNSLLQQRGAIYFKSLIPEPDAKFLHIKPKMWFHLPSTSTILDTLQSWLGPLVSLSIWGLLRGGIFTRGWFLFCMMGIHCLCGLRSFIAIVVERLATLKHVAFVVKARSGTKEEKERRRKVVTSKTYSLVIDLMTVLFYSVLMPSSVILFGSLFNSRQFVVHLIVVGVFLFIGQIVINVHLHSKLKKLQRESGIYPKKTTSAWKKNRKILPSDELSVGEFLTDGSSAFISSAI